MFCRRLPALILLIFTVSAGCRKQAAGPPPRYAVVRFENLSGDPSLEWMGRATSEYLSRSLAGAMDGPVLTTAALNRISGGLGARPATAPGISSERAEALLSGANRIIEGYVERAGGRIRVSATEENVLTGKSVRLVSAVDGEPLKALTAVAHEFSPTAKPYLTSNADALRLYVSASEGQAQDAAGKLEQSLQADPNFGPAWLLLANLTVAQGNRDAARDLIAKARTHPLDPLDRANLDLAQATLESDQKARITALRAITALSPGDTVLLRSVAQTEAAVGQFDSSAADWAKLVSASPNDPDALNQLCYARAWAGDYAGALAAAKEYAAKRPDDPNPLDTSGDIEFMYRKFSEAALAYLRANDKDPEFQKGGDLYKAAWAKYNAGDKTGADAAFEKFRAFREKSKSSDILLFRADWLYRTGRQKEAVDLLRGESPAAAIAAQLVVWDLLAHDRVAAAKDAEAVGKPTSPATLLARFIALPSASVAEWESRAAQMIQGPNTAGLRLLALGYALLLDGKRDAAKPIWDGTAQSSAATDFFARAVDARLRGEQPKFALLPDPTAVNPFLSLLDNL